MENILEVSGLSKSFGRQQILRKIDFAVAPGTCVSFIGENGAGKSTLGKCLVGVHQPEAGEMRFKGHAVQPGSPRAAMQLGIGLLPQELAYVPAMTAYENIVLGAWPARAGFTSPARMKRWVNAELDRLGLQLDTAQYMSDLSLADRQLVEIAKALVRRADLLVLDEPTAALSSKESNDLIELLLRLKADGLSAIYISHRMDEVSRFSDVVNVLRNGEIVLSAAPRDTTDSELITAMLGQEPGTLKSTNTAPNTTVVCRADRLNSTTVPPLRDVSFDVRQGEVLGIFGVRGSGQDVVGEAFGGLRPEVSGKICIAEAEYAPFATPYSSQDAGVSYVPAERKRNGLVLGMSIRANIALPIARRVAQLFGVINAQAEREIARQYTSELDVRYASMSQSVGELSGGNQQKVLLGGRLAQRPRVLVLHEPSRGVDIGARLQIHEHLRELAQNGTACLLITSDVEEVVAVSDRILVMRDGEIAAELCGNERSQQNTIAFATGAEQ
ncbi:Putative ribose/galactose/methyl galactoside import ATP-binding protein 1 [Leucobacter sp. 7(1)]|uniref:sugar ABC transporter ATP-binding protein n=1 Tax=Leucobacter sp. 7(1) TaxID=1255613 RepID=UPI00097EFFCC|nr:sugar ABC transporter ATP-binding protein [Leucobacter sp. 7(1)]SJN11811.1 Putative ribose/galactose/methyl galactoside import ATP-binding protein 1 [Leucobacter sp. 7(1)]